jgi:hypothetical protein
LHDFFLLEKDDVKRAKFRTRFVFFVTNLVDEYLLSDVLNRGDSEIVYVQRSFLGKLILSRKSPVSFFAAKFGLTDFFTSLPVCCKFRGGRKFLKAQRIFFIFAGGSATSVPQNLVNRFAKKIDVKKILLFWDSSHAKSPTMIRIKKMMNTVPWDAIYTYDKFDSAEFGWRYIGRSYFSTSKYLRRKNVRIKTDAFFVGGLKGGREKLILDSFEKMHEKN